MHVAYLFSYAIHLAVMIYLAAIFTLSTHITLLTISTKTACTSYWWYVNTTWALNGKDI